MLTITLLAALIIFVTAVTVPYFVASRHAALAFATLLAGVAAGESILLDSPNQIAAQALAVLTVAFGIVIPLACDDEFIERRRANRAARKAGTVA